MVQDKQKNETRSQNMNDGIGIYDNLVDNEDADFKSDEDDANNKVVKQVEQLLGGKNQNNVI